MVVVEGLPFGQPLPQVHVVRVAQELVELLLIRAVRALHLAVELRRPGLDVHVPDALVGQVPVELGLELMPAVRAPGVNTEGELLDDIVQEGDGVLLSVAAIDLEGPHPGRIVDRRVLVAPDPLALRALQGQELHVDLDVMARDLLLVAVSVHRAPPDPGGEPVQPMALEGPVHRGVADPDAVIALQVPGDADGPEVIRPPQVQDLVDDGRRRRLRMRMGTGLLVDEPGRALPLIGGLPDIEEGPRNTEVAARLPDVHGPRRVLQHPRLTTNILLGFGHRLSPLGATIGGLPPLPWTVDGLGAQFSGWLLS